MSHSREFGLSPRQKSRDKTFLEVGKEEDLNTSVFDNSDTEINSEKENCLQVCWSKLPDDKLLLFTFLGIVIGVGIGFLLRLGPDINDDWVLVISYPGEIFLRALKCMIIPLVSLSILV